HAARRHGPAHQHAAGRDHRRRRRCRPLRHAPVRYPRGVRRRADGGAHAGVCGQEDRGQGGEDGHARHPGPASHVPGLDRRRGGDPVGRGLDVQPGPARLLGGALRLHLADRQQRLGLRRPHRQHALVQRHRRHRHAGRPLLDDHPGHGHCRRAGGQEARAAVVRHLPDHGRTVRRPGGGRDRHRRRPHLLPGARAGTHRRASGDACGHPVLKHPSSRKPSRRRGYPGPRGPVGLIRSPPMESSTLRRRMPVSALLDPKIIVPAIGSAFAKLDPRTLANNPIIFVLEIVTLLTTVLLARDLVTGGENLAFTFQIVLWLWSTVLFANFAEAVAEGRGKAQADALRRTRTETQAKLLSAARSRDYTLVPGNGLKVGDIVLVEAGDIIPSDGEVIEGVASVNEAAITGESAPVIREAGGDRSAVTGGTQVLSDWIRVRVTAAPGSTFLDRMIRLVEGAERQRTPNEIALNILLAGLSIVFVIATATIPSYVGYAGGTVPVVVLVALFVTLIPTTIGALLSAIGIAGMDRLVRFNVLAMSGRAVEAAGDVDTLLLDKTGTITLGNRQATAFLPLAGVSPVELADAAQLSSLPDETPEGRSIVVLAKDTYAIRGRDMAPLGAHFVPFSAQTRLSGIDLDGSRIRKGAVDAVLTWARAT